MERQYEEYKFRAEDFIPIVGVRNYNKRCLETMSKNHLLGEDYAIKSAVRCAGLFFYNMTIASGAIVTTLGLVSLLSK
jgi:hypothetical protein